MDHIKLIAPAKINLVLAIGDRLPDGYHEARTILHALALHDTIEIRCTDLANTGSGLTISVTCESAGGIDDLAIPMQDNIVYQATEALAQACRRSEDEHIDIAIAKQIPHQAGLGGGSSDAAAVLKGLALLWEIDPADPLLIEVAASLGADVPFFLYGGCAYLDHKGERFVHRLEPRKGFLALVRPYGDGISTKEAYRCFDEDPLYPSPAHLADISACERAIDVTPYNNLAACALKLQPALQEVFALLDASPHVDASLLCGSGSAVAALCADYENACAVSLEARKAGFYSRVTSFASLGAEVLKR